MWREDFYMPQWSYYRGQEVSVVPRNYLEGLLAQEWIDHFPGLCEAIETELVIRDRVGLED
jgi:hypothetical protein